MNIKDIKIGTRYYIVENGTPLLLEVNKADNMIVFTNKARRKPSYVYSDIYEVYESMLHSYKMFLQSESGRHFKDLKTMRLTLNDMFEKMPENFV
jgi:hypothetical protein